MPPTNASLISVYLLDYVHVPSDSVAQTRQTVTMEQVGLGAGFFCTDPHRAGQLTGYVYDLSGQLVGRAADDDKGERVSALRSRRDLAIGPNWGTQPTCLLIQP